MTKKRYIMPQATLWTIKARANVLAGSNNGEVGEDEKNKPFCSKSTGSGINWEINDDDEEK